MIVKVQEAMPGTATQRVAAFFKVYGRIFLSVALIVLVISGRPLPAKAAMGEDLLGVSFPSEKQGWVCGRYGVMYHSADGGKTWVPQETGTKATLVSVFFVDTKNGWAVGDVGTIIHTADGGKTWSSQKSPVPHLYLMDVFFVSPTKGWIVTERTHILVTDNGGKTWTVQFSDQDYILKSVSFADPLNGWAVGEYGYIYHTNDGGKSWKWQAGEFREDMMTGEIIAGNYLFGVTAIDAQRAWAVGIDGFVLKTLDGGKTWKAVSVGIGKISLASVTADRSGRVVVIAHKEGIVVSRDAGDTWKKVDFQPPIEYRWFYRVVRQGDVGYAAVGGGGMIYHGDSRNPLSAWRAWRRIDK